MSEDKRTKEELVVSSSTMLCTKGGKIVGNFTPMGVSRLDFPLGVCEANAEFAKDAFNSHDQLVEALKEAGGCKSCTRNKSVACSRCNLVARRNKALKDAGVEV